MNFASRVRELVTEWNSTWTFWHPIDGHIQGLGKQRGATRAPYHYYVWPPSIIS